jgi:hypothetical protein
LQLHSGHVDGPTRVVRTADTARAHDFVAAMTMRDRATV